MKQVILTLSIIIIFSISSPIISQETSPAVEKKVMIIKSTDIESEKGENIWINKDGESIDVEGNDMIFIGEDVSELEKDISVNINTEIRDGEEVRIFEISITENGKEKLIKWEDNGAIPEEVVTMLETEGIDINMFTSDEVTVTVDATEDEANQSVNVNIEVEEVNGVTERTVEITIEESGEKQKMKWVDNGETPAEIQEKLDELGIDLDEISTGGNHTNDKQDGLEKRVYKIDLRDGGEIPAEVRKELEQYDVDLDALINEAKEQKDGETAVGKKVRIIKSHDGDDDSDVEIIRLKDGEVIPDDVKQKLKDKGIDIENLKSGNVKIESEKSRKHVIKIKDENGEMKVIEWDGQGDMPAEMDKMEKEGHTIQLRSKSSTPANKAQLGVMIEEHDAGILVSDVIPESAAAKVGMMTGDVITHVNGLQVLDIASLMKSLSDKIPGDDLGITYLRDNVSNQAIARLTKPIQNQEEIHSFQCSDERVIESKENCDTNKLTNDENVDLLFKSILDTDKIEGVEKVIVIRSMDKSDEEKVVQSTETRELPNIDNHKRLTLDNFKAFPNPTSGFVNISFEGKSSPIVVQLSDISGRRIFKETLNNFTGNFNRDIDLSQAQKGQFILYVIQNQKVFTESLIVK